LPAQETKAQRSREEVVEAIRSLSAADWIRLRKAAKVIARFKPIEPDDLLQEAFRRAIEGKRNCPSHVDVVRFLCEAMRSIADAELQKIEPRPALVPISSHGAAIGLVDPPDPAPSAEQAMLDSEALDAIMDGLKELFDQDTAAQVIVEGIMEDMEGEVLRELTDLDPTGYQSKRKAIRRWLDKKFAKGWRG